MKYLGKDSIRFDELDTFDNPGLSSIEMVSDEVTSNCPITNQPDYYTVSIEYQPDELCIESKSLKLYLASFRNQGIFCEQLAVEIKNKIIEVIRPKKCIIIVNQKSRGGITIKSIAIGEQ